MTFLILKHQWPLLLVGQAVLLLLLSQPVWLTHAAPLGVSCATDKDCGETNGVIQGTSVCEDGKCTNPFELGCLNVMSEKYGKNNIPFPSAFERRRICNSDDDLTPKDERRCRKQKLADFFQYDEVRIAPGNWESSVVMAWIYQILLTELLEVPVTIENGDGKKGVGSFYDRTNGFTFVDGDYENSIHTVLWESERVKGDCSKTDKPCAHILPDVWDSGVSNVKLADGRMLPPVPNGMIGRVGYYIPEYTAKNHPELSSFYGLSGEVNRHNLAATFLTPVTWQFYCDNISESSTCTDSVTTGRPSNAADGEKYHLKGSYIGHFYTPPEGNCTMNPETCTGHFVNTNCNWATYGDAQTYWNDISLASRGPLQANNGYPYSAMLQIWDAAAATRNNVMMWWWYPDSLLEKFENTEFKFQRIDWKKTTDKCLRWRKENIEICSENDDLRRGSGPIASCDMPVEKLMKLMSKSLKDMNDNVPQAERSPTYPLMSQLKIRPYAMDDVLRNWMKIKKDFYGYDSRETTCKFVYDNVEMLVKDHFPKGYPREINELKSVSFAAVAYTFAGITMVVIILVAVLIIKFKDKQEMRYAQVEFLYWMIAGLFIIAIAAITRVYPSSKGTCITSEWGILIGYTLELAPILVKVQAMNIIGCENIVFRRIVIDTKRLRKKIIFYVTPVLVYLVVWTILDAPESIKSLTLDYSSNNQNVVDVDMTCSSASVVWIIMAYVWQFLLLLSSSVLAYQARGLSEEINESKYIGFLVYSHFMFLIFRIVAQSLSMNGSIPGTVGLPIVSILLSVDVLIGTVIYFGPKFYNIMAKKTNNLRSTGLGGAGSRSDLSELSRLRSSGICVIKKPPPEESAMKSSIKSNISRLSGASAHNENNSLPLDDKSSYSNVPRKTTKRLVSFMDDD